MKGTPIDIRGKKYHPVVGRIMMIHEACAAPQPKAVEISVVKTEETDDYIDVKATVTTHVKLNGDGNLTKLEYSDMAREYFEEKKGKFAPVNFAHALENASTSAIGRALRNAGFPGDDELIDDDTGVISKVEQSISAEEAKGVTRKNDARQKQVREKEQTNEQNKTEPPVTNGNLKPQDAHDKLNEYAKSPLLHTHDQITDAISKAYGDDKLSERAIGAWNNTFFDSTVEGSVQIGADATVKEAIEVSRGHEKKLPLHCFRNWTQEEIDKIEINLTITEVNAEVDS